MEGKISFVSKLVVRQVQLLLSCSGHHRAGHHLRQSNRYGAPGSVCVPLSGAASGGTAGLDKIPTGLDIRCVPACLQHYLTLPVRSGCSDPSPDLAVGDRECLPESTSTLFHNRKCHDLQTFAWWNLIDCRGREGFAHVSKYRQVLRNQASFAITSLTSSLQVRQRSTFEEQQRKPIASLLNHLW